MSKLIFSTLSILVLLLSGASCSTGKRGGGGGGSQIDELKKADESSSVITCEVDLELNPGDGCSGPNYTLRNDDGTLAWSGSYTKSCSALVYVGGDSKSENFVVFNGSAFSFSDSTGGRFICGDLLLARNGNAWTIARLPPPATTVR